MIYLKATIFDYIDWQVPFHISSNSYSSFKSCEEGLNNDCSHVEITPVVNEILNLIKHEISKPIYVAIGDLIPYEVFECITSYAIAVQPDPRLF